MTVTDARRIEDALSKFGQKTLVSKEDSKGDVWRVTLPFKSHSGESFRVYAFRRPRSKKIYLSDGRALLRTIQGCGQPHLKAIQELLGTFGLSLMEDLSVMDITDRPLTVRTMSFLQAWCAVDGMLRIWKIAQEEVQDALRAAA